MPKQRATFAIVYDFDGTLAPGNLQENSFIPDVGLEPKNFWAEVDGLAKKEQADAILMYMYLMLEKARGRVPVREEDFKNRGAEVEFFEGVEGWFDRISDYGREKGIKVEHYVVSSGNAEIIMGTSIASKFERIYASRFLYDKNGVACWPAIAINFTTKTQFLFRINKGALDPSDDTLINRFVKMSDRPVPFKNMVYIGDGETDVPCFRLVKDMGGLSIAVYKPRASGAKQTAERFIDDERVRFAAPANYSEGGRLDTIVKKQIDYVAAGEALAQEMT